jgi:hypothetical protein
VRRNGRGRPIPHPDRGRQAALPWLGQSRLVPSVQPPHNRDLRQPEEAEQVYKAGKGKVAILWVDLQGRAEQARKIVRHNHLTFPVVDDAPGASIEAWKIQAYPYWLLLDSRGHVIGARVKPQTINQLHQLLAKAK